MTVASKDTLARLARYKQAIDTDIAAYAEYVRATVRQQYGEYVADAEAELFLDMLSRGGKRIRGGLVMAGYEMCGGTNQKMIVQAARAIEMLQAYMLILDDIQDRSDLRRGKPTAHRMGETYHKQRGLKGDAAHAGIAFAMNAAVAGAHGAQAILANLDAEPDLRLKAISITNRTMGITAHGQTLDMINELVELPTRADIDRVLEWKTALYTVINPLHVGMVLAGADCHATDAITPYGHHAGRAFQITDDILGIYGDEKALGKTPGDDIREGKGTLLVLYALEHAKPADKAFLKKSLGNSKLTAKDFETCRRIIKDSGALAYAQQAADTELEHALASLANTKGLWSPDGTDFLKGLAKVLHQRVS
jgi:geranylgeranyl diphosphate synthase type I